MLHAVLARLTYANVVSTICLFIVLGGTSYAVATGSINSREIKNNVVGTKDLKNNSIRSRDIRNGTLVGADLSGSALASLRGPQGQQGAQGAAGTNGVSGYQLVTSTSAANSTSPKFVSALCPAGKKLLGGGAVPNNSGNDIGQTGSYPESALGPGSDQDGWTAGFKEDTATAGNWFVFVYAICGTVQ